MDGVPAAPPRGTAKKSSPALRIALAAAVVAGLFLVFRLLPIGAWIEELKTYVRGQGALGYLVFGIVYVGASLIPGGPAAIMTLAAGAVYGVVTGTILVSLASITAATLAFLLARGAFRGRVQKIARENRTFGSLNRAIEKEGAKIVALVRLSPVFPFTIVNYLFGLTPVKLASYFFASWIAMLPGTLAYVYFGSALGDVTGSATALQKTIKIGLAVAAVVATIFIARIAARAIRNAGIDEPKAPAAGPT
ncbi:MAG: TVP38/TMEM64 family protein [Acidobacteriota bacterium]